MRLRQNVKEAATIMVSVPLANLFAFAATVAAAFAWIGVSVVERLTHER